MLCHNLANDVANTCINHPLRHTTATTLALQNGGGDVFMDVKLVRLWVQNRTTAVTLKSNKLKALLVFTPEEREVHVAFGVLANVDK